MVALVMALILSHNTEKLVAMGWLTSWSGDEAPLLLLAMLPSDAVKTILFPFIGGLLQTPLLPAFTISGLYSSPCFVPGVLVGALAGQLVAPPAGVANTIQFPPISLNGLGILVPTLYGPRQIANPTPKVNVGAIYNLN